MSQKAESENKPTPQEAAELLEQDRQERIMAVEEGIQELLRKHNCSMEIVMSISTRRGVLGGEVIIVAGPPLPPPAQVETSPDESGANEVDIE